MSTILICPVNCRTNCHTGCGWNVGFNPLQKWFRRITHVRTPYISYEVLTHLLIGLGGQMSTFEVDDSVSEGPYLVWLECRI